MSDYKDLINTFLEDGGEIKKGKPMKRTKGISVQRMQISAETKGDFEQFQKGADNYERYKQYLKHEKRKNLTMKRWNDINTLAIDEAI